MDDIAALLAVQPVPTEFVAPEPATAAPVTETRRPRGRPRKDGTPAGSPRVAPAAEPQPEKAPLPMPDAGTIKEAMAGLYRFAAFGLYPVKPQTAGALMENAETIGAAWEAAAETNPAIRKALLALMTTSAWSGIALAHMPVVMVAMKEKKPKKQLEEVEAHGDAEVPQGARAPRRLRPT